MLTATCILVLIKVYVRNKLTMIHELVAPPSHTVMFFIMLRPNHICSRLLCLYMYISTYEYKLFFYLFFIYVYIERDYVPDVRTHLNIFTHLGSFFIVSISMRLKDRRKKGRICGWLML